MSKAVVEMLHTWWRRLAETELSTELTREDLLHLLDLPAPGETVALNQIGLARVVTDYATFAYLCDVYVLGSHRGHGLGRWLIECVMAHPQLQGLRRINLATRDAHGLYAQFGFQPLARPESHMELHKPDIYKTAVAGGQSATQTEART